MRQFSAKQAFEKLLAEFRTENPLTEVEVIEEPKINDKHDRVVVHVRPQGEEPKRHRYSGFIEENLEGSYRLLLNFCHQDIFNWDRQRVRATQFQKAN